MITAESLNKSFRLKGARRRALRDISFSLPAGKNLAILGTAGSGKSSLLRLIAGLDHPDSGRIRRFGSVSWPFGQMRFERGMSVSQNIRFLCRVLGERDFERVEHEITELTGFSRQFGVRLETLRPLEQRQLSVALSLAFAFDIMVLDGRPMFHTFDGAEKYRERFDNMLARSTVVLATDKPKEVNKTYEYFLVLDEGAGQLYDSRWKAMQAFREINKIPSVADALEVENERPDEED